MRGDIALNKTIERVAAALRTNKASLSNPEAESLARAAVAAMPKCAWVYTNGMITKVFASEDAARRWFAENDPEGVAFEYPIEG